MTDRAAALHLGAVVKAHKAIGRWGELARQPVEGDVADVLGLALEANEAMSSAEHTTRDAFNNFLIAIARAEEPGAAGQSTPRLEEVAGQVWEAYRLVRVQDPAAALRAIAQAKSALSELDSGGSAQ